MSSCSRAATRTTSATQASPRTRPCAPAHPGTTRPHPSGEMQSPSQGSAVMVARILDLLFIQILRAWAAGTDAEPNWLGRCTRPADRSGLECYPSRPWPRLDRRGAGPGLQPVPVGVRCAVRRSRGEAASYLSRARTPRRGHRPAPRHLPSGHAHRGERRLHLRGGIQPRVQAPLRHATGSLATRHTGETPVVTPVTAAATEASTRLDRGPGSDGCDPRPGCGLAGDRRSVRQVRTCRRRCRPG